MTPSKKYFDSVVKRDGRITKFDRNKITEAIFAAAQAVGGKDKWVAEELTDKVVKELKEKFGAKNPTVEEIQDIVERSLIHEEYADTAKAYILYREQRRQMRDLKSFLSRSENIIEGYLEESDWRSKENANTTFAFSGLQAHIAGAVVAEYTLNKIYPQDVSQAHRNADFHLHDLSHGIFTAYCAGWSLKQLLVIGFGGIEGRISARPASHFDAALGQLVNFFGVLQNEWAGAQAVSSFDTYLAPFVRKDALTYKQVKQGLQEFIFGINQTSRWGNQVPFTNVTLDWTVPEDLRNEHVIIGGKLQEQTYAEFQEEMNMINKAFIEVMIEGDSNGRIFTFPIPTYNITKDFEWDSETASLLFEMTAKYGIPYFQNFINSSLKPGDVRSMCLESEEKVIVKVDGKIKRQTIREFTEENCGEFNGDWAEPKKEAFSLSLNPESYKLEWAKVKSFYKTASNKIVKIRGKDGKAFKVSEEHPIAVYTEEGIKTKRAGEVKVGDFIIQTKQATECLNCETQEIEGLTLDEELARFLGLFTAEGNYLFDLRPKWKGRLRGLQFSFNFEKEKALVSFVSEFAEKRLGLKAKIRKDPRYNTAYCLIYNGKLAEKLIRTGFNKKGKLPNIIFNSPSGVIKAFIQGFEEGDSYAKGREIHINDKELIEDLSLLCSLVGIPTTLRLKKNSQVLRTQHLFGRGSTQGIVKNDSLYNRLPQFTVQTSKQQPFYAKQFMVSLSAVQRHNAHTEESKKLVGGSFCAVRVENVMIEESEKGFEFFDIELEKNHYFVHSLGNITHNCCRLQLNVNELKKLRHKTGGLFGAGELTGSVGVVTINLPKTAYLSKEKGEKEFFARLEHLMELAKCSLEIKRKEVQKNMDQGLLPYTKHYLGTLDNHFATIGICGMHEACLNLLGKYKGIQTKDGREFAIKVLDFMREKLQEFQQETGHLYNLEATPAEGTAYRLAKHDKSKFPDIIQSGKGAPFYTNSSHLPVDFTDDVFDALDHQDELQAKYTGGTVVHGFLGEKISDAQACKKLVKKIAENYHLPYFTITPTFSVCKEHGYIAGKHESCPVVVKTDIQKERMEVVENA